MDILEEQWVNEALKYHYKKILAINENHINKNEKVIYDFLMQTLSNTTTFYRSIENDIGQLIAAKPKKKIILDHEEKPVFSMPSAWFQSGEGLFGMTGSRLFDVLKKMNHFFLDNHQLIIKLGKQIQKAESLISFVEKSNSFDALINLKKCYMKIHSLIREINGPFWEKGSAFFKVENWICYEFTRLFNKINNDNNVFNLIAALSQILEIPIKNYTQDWDNIKAALASVQDLYLVKFILDDYIYCYIENFIKNGQEDIDLFKQNKFDAVLFQVSKSKKLNHFLVIRDSFTKVELSSLSVEELRELLEGRQKVMGKSMELNPFPLFDSFYTKKSPDKEKKDQEIIPLKPLVEIEERKITIEDAPLKQEPKVQKNKKKQDEKKVQEKPYVKEEIIKKFSKEAKNFRSDSLPENRYTLFDLCRGAFNKTFYVSKDTSFIYYFMGWPKKNNKLKPSWSQFFYVLEFIFYFAGMGLFLPVKNTIKLAIELLPKEIEIISNKASVFMTKHQFSIIGTIFSLVGYVCRGIWAVGRALISPIASLNAADATGRNFEKKYGKKVGIAMRIGLCFVSFSITSFGVVSITFLLPLVLPALVGELSGEILTIIEVGGSAIVLAGETSRQVRLETHSHGTRLSSPSMQQAIRLSQTFPPSPKSQYGTTSNDKPLEKKVSFCSKVSEEKEPPAAVCSTVYLK